MKHLIYIIILLTLHLGNAKAFNNNSIKESNSKDDLIAQIEKLNHNYLIKQQIRNSTENLNENQMLTIDSLDKLINEVLISVLRDPGSQHDSLLRKINFFNSKIASDDNNLSVLNFEDYTFRQFNFYKNYIQYRTSDSSFFVFNNISGQIPHGIYNVSQNLYLFEFIGRTCSSCFFTKLVAYELNLDSNIIEKPVFQNGKSEIQISYRFSDDHFLPKITFESNTKEIYISYRLFSINSKGEKIFDDKSRRNIFNQYVDKHGIVSVILFKDEGIYKIKE